MRKRVTALWSKPTRASCGNMRRGAITFLPLAGDTFGGWPAKYFIIEQDEKCWILCQLWKVLTYYAKYYANDEKCWTLHEHTSAEHPPLSVSVSGTLGISINLLGKHCTTPFGIISNYLRVLIFWRMDVRRVRVMIWVFGLRILQEEHR